ncbi:Histidine kinase-, DNA gyrase B-, and HSP90-like ATPase [Granulicella rosea]|uniref:histidine kinase n=1 Tax=Granulicella rosea TaxID=474952 RepID=A0A239MBY2_9BACT|nr:ATP-binding protein [Granulicella rosea]SNT39534.1 Histidine kinase-, DNA gyrase B-, and HSP90-like ATPase [Granulicella rosea]
MATTYELQSESQAAEVEPYLLALKPQKPTPLPEIVEALRTVTQLNGLADEEYMWLATHGTERMGCEGSMIFREGEPTAHLNFILRGEVHVRRRVSGPMALFIGRAGQMTGLLPFSRMKGYGGDGYTIGPSWVLDIHKDLFPEMLKAIPSMGQRCVSTLLDRVREVTRMEQQAEKLSALGKLAANLAHELNNPASAAQRTAASLFAELRQYGQQSYRLGALSASAGNDTSRLFKEWITRTRARMAEFAFRHSSEVSPLAQSDREDLFMQWLERHDVPEPWTIAPTLADTPLGLDQLDELAEIIPAQDLPLSLTTFASSVGVERMSETIVESTGRIFDLITAIKDYSYMDQAPIQDIDLAQSLENTLAMFGSRLADIKVETDFDPHLPPIGAYGSELNQVWTALIENALDAMPTGGTLRLTTRLNGQMAFVEVIDSGLGIAPTLVSRVFEPFYTTKAPGRGLGLGLDTAQRIVSKHSGFITVESAPGRTCFQVRLPIDQAQAY